jgi:hypothetical protein
MQAVRKQPETSRPRRYAAAALLAASLNCLVAPYSLTAQTSQSSGSRAKTCELMPTPELESTFKGKVKNPHGADGESSVCTVNIGGLAIKLQTAAPGADGVPTSIPQGLAGFRMMLAEARQSPKKNTKDFGNVGCMSLKMTKGFDGTSLAKPLFTASCFMVEGGYLNMSVAGENRKQTGCDVLKGLLEKAAARREPSGNSQVKFR